MMHYRFYPGFGQWGMGFGVIDLVINFIFWVLIIWGFVILIKSLTAHSHHYSTGDEDKDDSQDQSLKIIRERYAKGEIDKKEFEQLKKDLA